MLRGQLSKVNSHLWIAPFAIKHSYPGGGISTNVVALQMAPLREDGSVEDHPMPCTGFRFHERWIITAAHCLWYFGTNTNPRVTASVKQLSNGVWQVAMTNAKTDTPTNATIYFYRKGFREDSPSVHADDIAIIGLDKEDKAISMLNQQLKQLEASSMQAQQAMAAAALNKAPAFKQSQAIVATQDKAKKEMNRTIHDKKRFLQQPLDDYHFMTFSPESARIELAGKTANGYWFKHDLDQNKVIINRQLPKIYHFWYQEIVPTEAFIVRWGFEDEPGGMSGTPLIINGYVVGVGSGEGKNPLLTDEFTAFLKRYMGADYKQGLCVRSVANEEGIYERNQP